MPATLHTLQPMLAVTDLPRTIDFYRSKLGFTLMGTFGDPPVWCHLHRDGVDVMFNTPPGVAQHVPPRSREFQIFYIHTSDIVALRAELVAKGVEASPLRVMPYRMKEFDVRDPEGYWLMFGQETVEPPTVKEERPSPSSLFDL